MGYSYSVCARCSRMRRCTASQLCANMLHKASCETHVRASKGMHMRSPASSPHHAAAACQLPSRLVLHKDEAHAAACCRRSRLSRSTAAAARPSTSRKQHTSEP